jgi:chromate transporter
MGALIALALIFAELSLLSFGGGRTILPEMQREVVDVHHWMTAEYFAAMFGLAQAAPGPNMMIVSLIGWRVAGWPGVLTTTIATFGPSSVLMGVTLSVWRRFKDSPWRRHVQNGLAPVTIGLVAASALLITRTSDSSWSLVLITALCTVATFRTNVHPLVVLGTGALAGLSGIGLP